MSSDGAAANANSTTSSRKLGILEEDDEFEEFPIEDWEDSGNAGKMELAAAFVEDWDDETIEEEFANQLRAELQKLGN